MTAKYNNVILQGLAGLGLVGYNTIKTLIEAYDADIYKDYAEFFPNMTLIENGHIENQCVRIYQKELPKKNFRFINGPQPRPDELVSNFLQRIIPDIQELHKSNKIDLYLSFGAYVSKVLSHEDFQDIDAFNKEELAEKILNAEIEKKRNVYVATCGNLNFDEFIKEVNGETEVQKEPGGYITGLNGVLPALVGERLNIPTATIMVETTGAGTDMRSTSEFPLLSQFLGLLATKRALIFIEKVFDLNLNLETKIDTILNELRSTAKQEIIAFFDRDTIDDRGRGSDFTNDKMYT